MRAIRKYPRTRHLQGSRLQMGDEDLDAVPFSDIAGLKVVVEEKIDGANCAFGFDESGKLWLQSRGHYLLGGPRERHFDLFKQWANAWSRDFWDMLGYRYTVYGEWMYAKHTIFYDWLPHFFLEFDILDLETNQFLDTPTRQRVIEGLPLVSVPILHQGTVANRDELLALVQTSRYVSPHRWENLRSQCLQHGLDFETIRAESDPTDLGEGLYVKVEENGVVKDRFKYVRGGFLQKMLESGEHWHHRPLFPNLLQPSVDLFS